MRREVVLAALLAPLLPVLLAAAPALAGEQYGIGRAPTAQEVAGWDIDVAPDGAGLPPGRGSVQDGARLFAQACAGCHGADGNGGDGAPVPKLAGGVGTLASDKPVRTVGSYWPYATTLFDYIHRAMPLGAAQTLSADQVYAVSAFVLNLNGIVPADATLDARSLAAIVMPNRDGFVRASDQPGGP